MQMINMMYLVLMALLALNTSKAALAAFAKIDMSLEEAYLSNQEKINEKIRYIDSKFASDPIKNQKWKDLADNIVKESKVPVEYINEIKEKFIEVAGPYVDLSHGVPELQTTDSDGAGPQIMSQAKDGGQHGEMGVKMRDKVNAYRDFLENAILGVKVEDTAKVQLFQKIPEKILVGADDWVPWEYQTFHIPAGACMPLLTQWEIEVTNGQLSVLSYIAEQMSGDVLIVDKQEPMANAESNYLSPNSDYKADLFMAAWSSSSKPDVYVGTLNEQIKKECANKDENGEIIDGEFNTKGREVEVKDTGVYWPFVESKETLAKLPLDTNNNRATYEFNVGGSLGVKSYEGAIRVRKTSNKHVWYPFKVSYQIASKSDPVVSAMKMNVMYIGVDNPLNIVVPGYKPDKVKARLSDGSSLKQKKGTEWTAKPKKAGEIQVLLTVEEKDGSKANLKGPKFRIKRVPDPVATVGGKLKGGKVSYSKFKNQGGLIAVLENFDFDFKFVVQSYEMTYIKHRKDPAIKKGRGPVFGGDIKKLIKSSGPKDKVFFTNIKVKGDDGSTRTLPSIVFELF